MYLVFLIRFILFFFPLGLLSANITKLNKHFCNLDNYIDELVVENKKLDFSIDALNFNPSIVEYEGLTLLSFRSTLKEHDLSHPPETRIYITHLDQSFNPAKEPVLLDFSPWLLNNDPEDGRLFVCNHQLYILFNASTNQNRSKRSLFLSKINLSDGTFQVADCVELSTTFSRNKIEKNWSPFVYDNQIFLSYTLVPHRVLSVEPKTGVCDLVVSNTSKPKQNKKWPWGSIRGGTPSLRYGNYFLGFFHTLKHMKSNLSINGRYHYFMGAYLFENKPPFSLKKISPKVIIDPTFYSRKNTEKNVIYPCGFIIKEKFVFVAYGKDDQEVYIAKIDLEQLIDSLEDTYAK